MAKSVKKPVKDESKERPPWRPATQPKAGGSSKLDLRARILDVSKYMLLILVHLICVQRRVGFKNSLQLPDCSCTNEGEC